MKRSGVGLHRPLPALCLDGLLLSGSCAYRHSCCELMQGRAVRYCFAAVAACVLACMWACVRACLPVYLRDCVCDMAFPCRTEHFSLHIVRLCFHHQLLQKEASPMKAGRSTHLQMSSVSMCKLLK